MDRIGKKSQKTKEAAQKLARMMSHQLTTNDSDDDLLSDYNPPPTTSQSHGRTTSQIIRPIIMVCIYACMYHTDRQTDK
ncbi:hypothetical protein HanXRQr2_Chr12g0557511 [Helianthus annuus]|uniref:Uncharacterized protein n=2 Tax=Helianthus annuus TaxID=4232 RepID=A0A9K3HJ33_HELAN|nr:hypothetical protein HanXRQr2_Chr12g0557511 [Helianthus annuus]KAJ0864010.1 hypothetical protein HanPSC8_Chr12g0536731 [Helianthus annuus]